MVRDLDQLTAGPFDLLVVGGGALGAFAAWDAADRGLRTALIERYDFGGGTTAASGRVLHGGLRSLQYLDPAGALTSLREQATIATIAPNLVRPLPFLFPAGSGSRERALLRGAASAWRAVPRLLGLQRELPPPRFHPSAREMDPELRPWAPGGGLVVWDLQIRSPERLAVAVVRAAVDAGAVAANRVEARQTMLADGRVNGVHAIDVETGTELEVQARHTLNCAGPWSRELWRDPVRSAYPIGFARGLHLVAELEGVPACALGLDWWSDADSGRLLRGRRIFAMPWEDRTLVGATWDPVDGPPAREVRPRAPEIVSFAAAIRDRWPGLGLEPEGLRFATVGLYPVFGTETVPAQTYAASRRPLVLDHRARGGPDGLVSAVSVKLTTARHLAESLVDLVARRLADQGVRAGPCGTRTAGPLPHADPPTATEARAFGRTAAREEMARDLSDALHRRSTLGLRGIPARDLLERVAAGMGEVLGWDETRRRREILDFTAPYARMGIDRDGGGA